MKYVLLSLLLLGLLSACSKQKEYAPKPDPCSESELGVLKNISKTTGLYFIPEDIPEVAIREVDKLCRLTEEEKKAFRRDAYNAFSSSSWFDVKNGVAEIDVMFQFHSQSHAGNPARVLVYHSESDEFEQAKDYKTGLAKVANETDCPEQVEAELIRMFTNGIESQPGLPPLILTVGARPLLLSVVVAAENEEEVITKTPVGVGLYVTPGI